MVDCRRARPDRRLVPGSLDSSLSDPTPAAELAGASDEPACESTGSSASEARRLRLTAVLVWSVVSFWDASAWASAGGGSDCQEHTMMRMGCRAGQSEQRTVCIAAGIGSGSSVTFSAAFPIQTGLSNATISLYSCGILIVFVRLLNWIAITDDAGSHRIPEYRTLSCRNHYQTPQSKICDSHLANVQIHFGLLRT